MWQVPYNKHKFATKKSKGIRFLKKLREITINLNFNTSQTITKSEKIMLEIKLIYHPQTFVIKITEI